MFGLGPLEPLLLDATISDILVNTHKQVYIERNGQLELTSVTFKDDGHLYRIIDKIVSQVGRRVDESSPMVDARLSDGSRVNAIIPPLAVDGPLLSIRRFATDKLMPDDLVAKKSITQGMMDLLKGAVTAKLNLIISGGTGSGKTTMLNALSAYISPTERVVTIEDAAELQLKQPHVVRLETRPPNLEGEGAVRQRELLVNSLRMRPDRIVIGECRGEEALDMLQAMNTGHDGSMTTVHANTPRDVITRLEVMVSLASSSLPVTAIRSQNRRGGRRHCPDRTHERRYPPLPQYHRSDHDGRRYGDAPGYFRVREAGSFQRRQSAGPLCGHGNPAPLLRKAARRGHSPSRRDI